jgi:hypothetical protein
VAKKTTKVVKTEAKPLYGETYRAILVGKVDSYKAKSGTISDSGLSRMIFGNDPSFINNLRDGGNFTLEKALRLERWLQHSVDMMEGKVPPGPLPPIKKERAVGRSAREAVAASKKARKPKPAVAKPAKNVVPMKRRKKA